MAKSTVKKKKTTVNKQQIVWASGMPFGRLNYILMLLGIVVLAIGYILLSGGGSEDPAVFSEAIFDTRRLIVAPVTIIAGLAIGLVAILIKVKTTETEQE